MIKQYGLDIQSQQDTYIRPIKDGGFYRVEDVQVLVNALDGIQETYAGMDGFVTETAPEAYQGRIIQQMYEIAKQSLKDFRNETT